MTATFEQVKRLEGLAHSMGQARDRKRKGLMLHAETASYDTATKRVDAYLDR